MNQELICLLINAGAEVNLKNFSGQTPLEILCRLPLNRECKSTMLLLLEHPSIKTTRDKLPLDIQMLLAGTLPNFLFK